jgi:Fe-S-cluster formation regulator IscX/YfhJ
MNAEVKEWLEELSGFLTADAWSEERIQELLANVWLDGYKQGQGEK